MRWQRQRGASFERFKGWLSRLRSVSQYSTYRMATILILGGLGTRNPSTVLQVVAARSHRSPLLPSGQDGARQLVPYLLSPAGPSPAFVRIVDRYFILPQADPIPSTTYLDLDAREALSKGSKDGKVEYLQGNLLTEGEYSSVATGAVRAAAERCSLWDEAKWGDCARCFRCGFS